MMTSDPYYQMWSVLQRTSQEMMWDAVSTSVERQLEELARKAGGLKRKLGSLTVDPSLPCRLTTPRWIFIASRADIIRNSGTRT